MNIAAPVIAPFPQRSNFINQAASDCPADLETERCSTTILLDRARVSLL